jgi:alkylation response protein AidB-like acyl-CoA dehydrogenase
MDFTVSVAARELGERFRRWIAENLPPEWTDIAAGSVGEAQYASMRRAWGQLLHRGGWSAPTWPTEYGGLGLTIDEQLVYLTELVNAGAPEPLNTNPIGVLGPCLMRYGSSRQRERILPGILSHELIGCQCFSEPDAGSDLANLRTRATKVDGGWIVNGQKVWTTNAQLADFCYALVRTEPGSQRRAGVSFVLIDMRAEGAAVRPLTNIAGSAEFNEVFFTDVFIADDDVVGDVGRGWDVAMYALSEERTTGIAQRALRLRRDLGNLEALHRASAPPLSNREAARWEAEFEQLGVETRAVEAAVYRNLALAAQGEDISILSPMAIYTWSAAHQRLRRIAMQRLGPSAIRSDGPSGDWNRSMLFARSATIAGGTTQIQLNNIAKGLGLPSSRS